MSTLAKAILAVALAWTMNACAVESAPDAGSPWETVQEAEPPQTPQADQAGTHQAQSLGSPFRLLAAPRENAHAEEAARARTQSRRVPSSWVMMSSDACDVTLDSLMLEVLPAGYAVPAAMISVASTGPAVGLVTSSDSASFAATFSLEMAVSEAGDSDAPRERVLLRVEASEQEGSVQLRMHLQPVDTHGAFARAMGSEVLELVVPAEFTPDPATVPERRRVCPR